MYGKSIMYNQYMPEQPVYPAKSDIYCKVYNRFQHREIASVFALRHWNELHKWKYNTRSI
jgi:hypothetical protein